MHTCGEGEVLPNVGMGGQWHVGKWASDGASRGQGGGSNSRIYRNNQWREGPRNPKGEYGDIGWGRLTCGSRGASGVSQSDGDNGWEAIGRPWRRWCYSARDTRLRAPLHVSSWARDERWRSTPGVIRPSSFPMWKIIWKRALNPR